MPVEPKIELDGSAAENGLAFMFRDLVAQNLKRNRSNLDIFKKLRLNAGFNATDLDIKLTMSFGDGGLTIYDGIKPDVQVVITADSETLLELTLLSVKYGLPWLFDGAGLKVSRKFIKGSLRIDGLLRFPVALIRLTKLFSVK